jgi:hypothetical protein
MGFQSREKRLTMKAAKPFPMLYQKSEKLKYWAPWHSSSIKQKKGI